jgi:hypothetical protein
MMLPALKLSLHGFQLRDHPLLRRDSPDDESSVGGLPTEVGEAQEGEVSGFPSPRCFRSRVAKRPNSISRVLSACNSKPKLGQPLPKFPQEPLGARNEPE